MRAQSPNFHVAVQTEGKSRERPSKSQGQSFEKAPDAINFSDEEDMIDEEEAAPAVSAAPAPASATPSQCVCSWFASFAARKGRVIVHDLEQPQVPHAILEFCCLHAVC